MSNSISVIMACYYGDRYGPLVEAVESVFSQTIPFFEFIIVVDGSVNSEIGQYLRDLESNSEENIILIWLRENHGAAHARNIGMKTSRGDYIAIMDSDDIIVPEKLEVQYHALKNNNVDAVWGWQTEFYDGSNNYAGIKKCPENHEEIIQKLKFRCLLSDPTTFIKRKCFEETGGYGEYGDVNIDYKFFLKMYLKGFKFYCVPKVLIKVRVSAEQRQRRGGLALLKQDYSLRKWMHKKGIINMFELAYMLAIYAVFRLQPNFLRDQLYLKVLRRH